MNVPIRARRLPPALVLGLLFSLLLVSVALAQDGLGDKFRSGSEVTVGSGETVQNDLYVFGGTITVDGTGAVLWALWHRWRPAPAEPVQPVAPA